MMASQKNNFVVNYFTLDISDLISQTQSSDQSSIACKYEILTEGCNNVEFISSDVIEGKLINKLSHEENNNNSSNVDIIDNIILPNGLREPSENDGETSHEVTSDDDDDLEDLTNLNWLTELKNITNLPPAANEAPEKPCDPPSQRFDKFMNQVHKIKENYDKRSDIYRLSSSEKPPYNYAQIIAMAMLDEGRMTLKQICDWIENRFAYYRLHRNWNVSCSIIQAQKFYNRLIAHPLLPFRIPFVITCRSTFSSRKLLVTRTRRAKAGTGSWQLIVIKQPESESGRERRSSDWFQIGHRGREMWRREPSSGMRHQRLCLMRLWRLVRQSTAAAISARMLFSAALQTSTTTQTYRQTTKSWQKSKWSRSSRTSTT